MTAYLKSTQLLGSRISHRFGRPPNRIRSHRNHAIRRINHAFDSNSSPPHSDRHLSSGSRGEQPVIIS
eukprot:3921444-Prymnesium_polylepis.2